MTRVLVTRASRRPPTAFCHLFALVAALGITWAPATAAQGGSSVAPRENRIPVGDASLYVRDIGTGQPVIILHVGPDFDQRYLVVARRAGALLPERAGRDDERGGRLLRETAPTERNELVVVQNCTEDMKQRARRGECTMPPGWAHSSRVTRTAAGSMPAPGRSGPGVNALATGS